MDFFTGGSEKWQIGDKIEDRYQILSIKKGGMGVVYIARDNWSNQIFAVKTFQDEFVSNSELINRFLNEAEIWVKLEKHTNIVFANFVQIIEGKPCIFLEYIEGGNLSQFIGRVPVPIALNFAIQFCNGMAYAYKTLGVVHRDIKPQNAMITTDGVLKVTDFGLATVVRDKTFGKEIDWDNPVISRVIGTPHYMAPEQFPEVIQRQFHFPLREVSTRSDICSFGITLYQVLTGGLPFSNAEQLFSQDPPNSRTLNPDISEELELLLKKCMMKDPSDRYESFEQLMYELVNIYNTLPKEQRIFGDPYEVKGKKELLNSGDWSNKGMSLSSLGRDQEAIICCDRALELDSDLAAAWSSKGVALGNLGRDKESIACCDKALEIDPALGLAWSNKGVSLHELGRDQEALNCFEKALEINPKDAWARVNKGLAMRATGRHQDALDCLSGAVEINPRLSEAWYDKGGCLADIARHQEAIDCFDRALEINPRETKAWYNKGTSEEALGRHQEAIGCFDKALELDPQYGKAWNNKGVSLQRIGRDQEVMDCFDRALEINPKLTEAWYNKGTWLQDLGRHQEAVDCFDMVVKIDPSSNFASYASKQKELSQLVLELDIPEGLSSGVVARYAAKHKEAISLFLKGLRLRDSGRHQEAISHFRKFIEFVPPENAELIRYVEEIIRQEGHT